VLRIFAIFSLLVTVLGLALPIFGPKHLKAFLVPFIGWSPTTEYMFGLYFAFALIFMRVPPMDSRPLILPRVWNRWLWNIAHWLWQRLAARPYAIVRFGFIAPLVIQMLDGFWTVMAYDGIDYGNPYLRVSPWQPLWTMGLPALWILVLFSPPMNRFCHRPAELANGLEAPRGAGMAGS
jgi:hypothetical protein